MWAYVPILSFFDQQLKFATSATCVAKLTLAARQPSFVKFFVLRCLKYFSVNWLRGCSKIKAFMNAKPPPPLSRRLHLWNIFFALPVKNGSLPAKLKFRENTVQCIMKGKKFQTMFQEYCRHHLQQMFHPKGAGVFVYKEMKSI